MLKKIFNFLFTPQYTAPEKNHNMYEDYHAVFVYDSNLSKLETYYRSFGPHLRKSLSTFIEPDKAPKIFNSLIDSLPQYIGMSTFAYETVKVCFVTDQPNLVHLTKEQFHTVAFINYGHEIETMRVKFN